MRSHHRGNRPWDQHGRPNPSSSREAFVNDQRNARTQEQFQGGREQDKAQRDDERLMGDGILEQSHVIAESDKGSLLPGESRVKAQQK